MINAQKPVSRLLPESYGLIDAYDVAHLQVSSNAIVQDGVKWCKPLWGWVKLNSDAAIGNL